MVRRALENCGCESSDADGAISSWLGAAHGRAAGVPVAGAAIPCAAGPLEAALTALDGRPARGRVFDGVAARLEAISRAAAFTELASRVGAIVRSR